MSPRDDAPPALVDAALELVRRRTGLAFIQARRPAFESDLLTCMRRAGLDDLRIYLERLAENPALFDELAAEITVGETYFLRDADQWNLLRTRLLPVLLARHGGDRPLRIWSAGCASGEEPYSAALVLHQLGAAGRALIVGTDLSHRALARARRGEYPRWALRNVPDEIERLYFRPKGQRLELVPWMRRQVEFRYLNLAEDASPSLRHGLGAMDLILCRNVLIYFDQKTIISVARRLLDSLADEGWLMLGASDPLLGGLLPCEVEVTDTGLVYRKAGHRAPAPMRQSLPPAQPENPAHLSSPASPERPAAVSVARSATAEPDRDRLNKVRRRYAAKDYAGTAALALRMIRGGESEAEIGILLVRSLANQGELAEAGRACAAALDTHRTCPELVFLHAVLLAQGGRYVEAADALRRALYLDRSLVVAHLALGDALARLGDASGARRAFQAAERLLADLPPEQPVAASDGEPAARLAEAARSQLRMLDHSAA
jgi:chemotaxis protein methyltransferase CheR